MKKFISGIVVGLSIALALSVGAEITEYILTKADYPLWVKDKEYISSDLPILNYEGSTYIPLRKIGDILGVKVNWNEELGRAEVGMTEKIKDTEVEKIKIDEADIVDGWISQSLLGTYGIRIYGHFEPPHLTIKKGNTTIIESLPLPLNMVKFTQEDLPMSYDKDGIKLENRKDGMYWHIDTLRQLGIAE